MSNNALHEIGILLQGKISEWTSDIIREYQVNFPRAQILVSTWQNENVDDVPCQVVKSKLPSRTFPYSNTVNHQIIGTKTGLENMNCDVILKCRTDQFIHNHNIFKIFTESCPKNKIMVPGIAEIEDYWVDDFCQIGKQEILHDYWDNLPYYDGSYPIANEVYLTKNFILKIKHDYIKDYDKDFQIEFEKRVLEIFYQKQWNKSNYMKPNK